jgi:lipid II:glycine glycyltransferase (peptidoglycan interpeptide bridge formation enzyme)
MQLLNYKEHPGDLALVNEHFPFSFQKSYSAYAERTGNRFFLLKNGSAMAPVLIKKSKFLVSLQFLFKPLDADAIELSPEEETTFLNEAVTYITAHKLAHRIVQPLNFALFSAVPDNCSVAPYGSYIIDLKTNTEEQLLGNMQARYRTAIRSAEKLNPEIRTGKEELNAFWDLHKTTMDRTGMYYEPFDELKDLYETAGKNVLIANCYINNELQGGVYIAWSKYGAYYLHGASAHTPLSDGAIKSLHYHCMCSLKQQGVARYDFVGARLSDVSGTKLEGIQNFKKRFGAELKEGYLWKKDISPFFCMAYDSLLHLKLALKGIKVPEDIIDQEKKR